MARPHDAVPAVGVPIRATGGTYWIHPLTALDGTLLYVTLNGEAVGSWFDATDELAVQALARHLSVAATDIYEGTST